MFKYYVGESVVYEGLVYHVVRRYFYNHDRDIIYIIQNGKCTRKVFEYEIKRVMEE